MDHIDGVDQSSSTSPDLPNTPSNPPATPIQTEFEDDPSSEEADGRWSPCPDEIIELDSSTELPQPKRLITDFFNRSTERQAESVPNFLCRFEPQAVHRETQPTKPAQPQSSASSRKGTAYKTYTLGKKLEVLEYVKSFNESQAASHFGIPRTTISSWKGLNVQPKKQPSGMAKTKGKHLAKGSGRPLSYPQSVEDEIVSWILQMRDLQLPVQRKDII